MKVQKAVSGGGPTTMPTRYREEFLLRFPVAAERDSDCRADDCIMPSHATDSAPPPFTVAGQIAHGIFLGCY